MRDVLQAGMTACSGEWLLNQLYGSRTGSLHTEVSAIRAPVQLSAWQISAAFLLPETTLSLVE